MIASLPPLVLSFLMGAVVLAFLTGLVAYVPLLERKFAARMQSRVGFRFLVGNVELMWKLAAVMAVCNLTGSILGSRMALRHGTGFVRKMFLAVVTVLILRLAYDTFLR